MSAEKLNGFAKRLGEALEIRGYRPADLAKECEVYNSTVHHWVKLGRKPKPAQLCRIAKFLKVKIDWLTSGEGDRDFISETGSVVILQDRIAASLKRIESLENEMAAVQRESDRRNAEWDQWKAEQEGVSI